jgi:hypothetical protein
MGQILFQGSSTAAQAIVAHPPLSPSALALPCKHPLKQSLRILDGFDGSLRNENQGENDVELNSLFKGPAAAFFGGF